MARQTNRLNARSVTSLTEPGRHADGNGLYLVVDHNGAKRWSFIFRWQGKLKEMGLGGLSSVTLARARDLATEARQVVADGKNPIQERRKNKPVPTFGEMADEVVTSLSTGWKNAAHRRQWKTTLEVGAKAIRPLAVDAIGTDDILKVLQPIWLTKSETASRLRGRIERVLSAAKVAGHIKSPYENPARWRGHLDHLLPKRKKLSRGHHKALPYADVPAFVLALRKRPAVAAMALEWTILTTARSNETFGATWGEIDEKEKLWVVPAARMKEPRDHRVPLPARAMEILEKAKALRQDGEPGAYIFPGQKRGRPLSPMSMDMLLRRMSQDCTVHGFRSSFRDWVGDQTNFPRELAEAALSHAVGDETEQAYRRGDALAKRRKLMDAWAAYCAGAVDSNINPMDEAEEAVSQ